MGNSLGDRIRKIRTKKGMPRKKLAQAAGLSEKTIANYETNRTEPSRDRLYEIAAALDVPLSALVGRAMPPAPEPEPASPPESATLPEPVPEQQSAPTSEPGPAPEQPAETLYEIVNRMCTGRACEDCVVGRGRAEGERLCVLLGRGVDVEATITAIRQWAAENPPVHKQTYRDDFFAKFPDAPRREDGAPLFAVEHVYKNISDARRAEFQKLTHSQRWAKPLGYWSQCAG